MRPEPTKIAVITFTGVMQTAVHGLSDMFMLANRICAERGLDQRFFLTLLDLEQIDCLDDGQRYTVVLIPPMLDDAAADAVDQRILDWLRQQQASGVLLCSVCAGAFILAATGLLDQREATTHWMLGEKFQRRYPLVDLNTDKILIDDGEIITAGGLMAWIDLGLELVARFASPGVMRELGRYLVVDTGGREQRYYQRFLPSLDHGDPYVLKAQKLLHTHYRDHLTIASLAQTVHLTERTFLRRFVKATGVKPNDYLQQLRVNKACALLEETRASFESIATAVGYGDTSACRKAFVRVTGLSPTAYRRRFVAT